MMWLMMLACAVPIIITSFGGSGSTRPIIWATLGLGLMFLLHWIMMKVMHRNKSAPPDHTNPTGQDSASDNLSHHH